MDALGAPGLPVSAVLGLSGTPGVLSLWGEEGRRRLAEGLRTTLRMVGGKTYQFPADFRLAPDSVPASEPAEDEVLGLAQQLRAAFVTLDGSMEVTLEVTVAQDAPALHYQVHTQTITGVLAVERFLLSPVGQGGFPADGPVEYVSIQSTGPVQGGLRAGQGPLLLPLPQGTPLLLREQGGARGVILGVLDETPGRAEARVSFPGRGAFQVELTASPRLGSYTVSPRFFLGFTETRDLAAAFAPYRAALDVVTPAPPVPAAFRHQWGSWYVYYGEIDEELIRAQIDTLAGRYGDLGPWQVVVDAGWYYAGAHPDGEMGLVDVEKFPSGMRALVDYAHERGVGVVLYGSAPWVDTRPSQGNWWVVLQGFVRDHLDWLVLVEQDAEGASYVYDFSHPQLREYLAGLIYRYLVEFDADGILLDMVGLIGRRGAPLLDAATATDTDRHLVAQTMEVYRFVWDAATWVKPEVWIEGAWAAPPLARRYAHSWRFGDEFPAFSNPYPFGGLVEHITFAILQEQLLGRRSHVGFIYGGDEVVSEHLRWLAAAVALQRQVVMSVDLFFTPDDVERRYREYLNALTPFAGTSVYGPGVPPREFSTTVDSTIYLGLLNTSGQAQAMIVDLEAHGMPPVSEAVVFDPETRVARGISSRLSATVAPGSFKLQVVRWEPGVLWGDRAWSAALEEDDLVITLLPGPVDYGRLWVYAPRAFSVTLDGERLPASAALPGSEVYVIEVEDGKSHEIRLRF